MWEGREKNGEKEEKTVIKVCLHVISRQRSDA